MICYYIFIPAGLGAVTIYESGFYDMQKTGKIKQCKTCGKDIYVSGWQMNSKFYCSNSCRNKGRIGLKHNTKKIITNGSGYKGVYIFDYFTHNSRTKYVPEHRLIMEKKIGRKLTNEEIVHHIDGNRQNNNPENLMLLPNKREHGKLHWLLRKAIF